MSDFLVQLMTKTVDLDSVKVVYDNKRRDTEENCVMLLHDFKPVMLRHGDANEFRNWYQAQLAGTGSIPASSPARLHVLTRISA